MKILNYLILLSLIIFTIISCKASSTVKLSKEDFDAIEEISLKAKDRGRVDYTENENKLYDLIQKSVEMPVFIEKFKILKAGYITIIDENRQPTVGMTVTSDGEKIFLEKGYNTEVEPFMNLMLTEINIVKMHEIFSDNQVNEVEDFLISNLFFIPIMERILQSREIRYFKQVGKVKVPTPNFCELKNPVNYKLPPQEDWTKITVYEEDGLYKVKIGHEGTSKAYLYFEGEKMWDSFLLMWDVLNEEDFDAKVKKYDQLQDQLMNMSSR